MTKEAFTAEDFRALADETQAAFDRERARADVGSTLAREIEMRIAALRIAERVTTPGFISRAYYPLGEEYDKDCLAPPEDKVEEAIRAALTGDGDG